jgi:hypothetical protein
MDDESQWIQVNTYHIHQGRGTCPPIHINNVQHPQTEEVKYLGLHLDRRLAWHKHIFTKWKQLGITLAWLLRCKSKLSTNNKFLISKTILKPIWTYGIQLGQPHPCPT